MGLNDITLGFGGGGSGLLEDILSHYADVSFQWRGGGGGGGGSANETFHSVKGVFFVWVLEESP